MQASQGCVKPECIDQAGKLLDFRCRRVSFQHDLQLAETSDRIKLVLPQQSFDFADQRIETGSIDPARLTNASSTPIRIIPPSMPRMPEMKEVTSAVTARMEKTNREVITER